MESGGGSPKLLPFVKKLVFQKNKREVLKECFFYNMEFYSPLKNTAIVLIY
jgi:hypothetical protein